MAFSYCFERCHLGVADYGENGTLVNGLICLDLRLRWLFEDLCYGFGNSFVVLILNSCRRQS